MTAELGLTTDTKPASGYTAEINSAVYSMNQFLVQGIVPFNIMEP